MALSTGIILSGCGTNKNDYYVPIPKVEPIPKEESIKETIACTTRIVNDIREKIEIKDVTISAVGDCTIGTDTHFDPQRTLPDIFEQVNKDYSYFF